MRNRTYGGVRGRKTKVGRKLLRFPPTRFLKVSDFPHFLSFYANLSLSELSTTLTLEKAIRALAHIGVIWKSMPKI